MKYKIESFTQVEIVDLTERYAEWALDRNVEWVEKEYQRTVKSTTNGTDIDLKTKEYKFIENYAQRMYVFEKLKDCHMHSSLYIDKRIGEHELEGFNDEISQRITLEEIENNFNSDFINKRVEKNNFESF